MIRDRDWRWLWHVPTSGASLLGLAWGWRTFKTRAGENKLVADLQVKQTLKR